jgi:hypothetical protein
MQILLAATKANEGGVNLLPIVLVVLIVIIGLVAWKRRANR